MINNSPVRVFARHYCGECLSVHWMEEITRKTHKCYGQNYLPKESATHYTRWQSDTIELVEKIHEAPCVTDWLFAEPEKVEEIQDW